MNGFNLLVMVKENASVKMLPGTFNNYFLHFLGMYKTFGLREEGSRVKVWSKAQSNDYIGID